MEITEIVELPKFLDERGNLSFLEENRHVPFRIKRVYWIYDVPGGEIRGGHAFKQQEELIVSLSGSFDVVLNNGSIEKKYHLNRSYIGLYVSKGIWRQIENFSTNSVAMVIASTDYNMDDYVYDFEEYKRLVNGK